MSVVQLSFEELRAYLVDAFRLHQLAVPARFQVLDADGVCVLSLDVPAKSVG